MMKVAGGTMAKLAKAAPWTRRQMLQWQWQTSSAGAVTR
jgi:hypothetical protein